MAGSKEPLDEVVWRSSPLAQSMGVLPYFSQSSFFDATSNNATLTTQATYNPQMFHILQTREAFEGRLRTMQGVEFMVAHEPPPLAQPATEPQAEVDSAWVIRKQMRRKRQGYEDIITVLSTYFVVGENIYMSPTVGNLLGSRLLASVTSLTQFLSTASHLPLFTPSIGHTYAPPPSKPLTSALNTQQSSQASKGSSPLPETPSQSQTTTTRSTKPPLTSTSTSATDFQEARSLAESLSLTLRYGSEYMDENPLVGEPGAFHLSSTHAHVQAQNQAQNKVPTGAKTSAPPTPLQKPLQVPAPAQARKGSKGGEKSPTTPGGAPKPKRRKSKALSALGGPASPK
ncbi:MAG: Mediator of RNA polymerase II transcription subunit 6 [Candelina submexicana]|nr:MAG: Mediator of RNA polymerase II transcription subunit 6 [Candelina submexicana]